MASVTVHRTLFFTVASGRYEMFAVPYALGVLQHNEDAIVEIVVDNIFHEASRNRAAIAELGKHFPDRAIFRTAEFDSKQSHKARFLIEPTTSSEFVYIGDVDVLVLESDVTEQHLSMMRKSGLPYSNVQRPGTLRLTGLHFTRRQVHYPLPSLPAEAIRTMIDEEILYEQVRLRGMLPAPELGRPLHGFHMSPNRPNIMPKPGLSGPYWGVTPARWKAYQLLASTAAWRAVQSYFVPEYNDRLAALEDACANTYGS